jgi:hypothetical protein
VKAKSIFGTETAHPGGMPMYSNLRENRLVSAAESLELAKFSMEEGDVANLKSIIANLGKVAYVTAEILEGECSNVNGTPLAFNTHNTYRGYESTYSEYTGCNSLALHSKYAYGCGRIIESEFCIKCFNSQFLSRCLEMDCCNKCADSYFCHNCEGLSDCMFCFNMKGARHCIGNTQLTKGQYALAKDFLLSAMHNSLQTKTSIPWSIYSIGARK